MFEVGTDANISLEMGHTAQTASCAPVGRMSGAEECSCPILRHRGQYEVCYCRLPKSCPGSTGTAKSSSDTLFHKTIVLISQDEKRGVIY